MRGKRPARQFAFQMVPAVVPDTPPAQLLERIGQSVDFDFIHALAAPYFAARGRPSVDPVVMVKMMLLGYLFGVPSDRQLASECADRLSFREFLGYELHEALPDHSSFTRWRQRLGQRFFDDVLHEIVRQCAAHGMPLCGARCVDATAVKAQAGKQGPVVRVPQGAAVEEFLDDYFGGQAQPAAPDEAATPINTHDPDARAQTKPGQPYGFYYQASFSSCPASGLICDATASGREQARSAVAHVDRDPLGVSEVCADSLYDHGPALAALSARGVTAYVPLAKRDKAGQLSRRQFVYDAARDVYVCPAGQVLKHSRHAAERREHFYTARASDCGQCPLQAQCTRAKRRTVTRKDDEWARQRTVREGPRYEALMAARQTAEHLNLLAKRDHGMRRARGLGREAMAIQAALTAVVIDLKKLVAWRQLTPEQQAIMALALRLLAALLAQRLAAATTAKPARLSCP